jgi:hypothetical protein
VKHAAIRSRLLTDDEVMLAGLRREAAEHIWRGRDRRAGRASG